MKPLPFTGSNHLTTPSIDTNSPTTSFVVLTEDIAKPLLLFVFGFTLYKLDASTKQKTKKKKSACAPPKA
jgi:hypothetical protein